MNFCIQEHTNVIKCFFSIVRTYIFHQIQVVLIVITFQKLWCFMIHGTYFFGFSYLHFIHHIVNNSVVFLFFVEPFPRYGIAPEVLSMLGCSILNSKFAQDLTFFKEISSTVDHTGFRFALRVIYILFTALAITPILRGVSVLWGIFSYIIPTESSTVGLFLSSFYKKVLPHLHK